MSFTEERAAKIVDALKNTTAYGRSVDYVLSDESVVIYSIIDDNFIAMPVLLALNPFIITIKAWRSKVYLEIK